MEREKWKQYKDDIYVCVMWNKGLETGEETFFSMKDLENGNVELPNDLKNDILEAFKNLSFTDLKKLSNEELLNNEAFYYQCFSSYKDFEEYVKSHDVYASLCYGYTRDGATLDARFWFYVFM